MKRTTLAALAVAALALTGCTAATAEPVVKTEAKAVTKTVTPEECTDALDSAESIIDLLSDALLLSGDAMDAAISWDADTLDDLTADLGKITPKIEEHADAYWAAAAKCRGERA